MSEKILPQSDVTVTPTLTNAQKYSPEFGFEPGVVVEVILPDDYKIIGFFMRLDYGISLTLSQGNTGSDAINANRIKSIRILSGPFSIWNFAPKGAVGCLYAENARTPVMFYKHPETFAIDKLDPDMDGDFMPAPWWWLEGQK